jgi:hypothetical protein
MGMSTELLVPASSRRRSAARGWFLAQKNGAAIIFVMLGYLAVYYSD